METPAGPQPCASAVAPSTQPKVEFLGRTEAYDIAIIRDDGTPGTSVRRVVRRGEVIELRVRRSVSVDGYN